MKKKTTRHVNANDSLQPSQQCTYKYKFTVGTQVRLGRGRVDWGECIAHPSRFKEAVPRRAAPTQYHHPPHPPLYWYRYNKPGRHSKGVLYWCVLFWLIW